MTLFGSSTATFSPCRKYRYTLERIWDEALPLLLLVMLNPSKATEVLQDPTVERQQRRAHMLGFGGLLVANLFAYMATDPEEMKRQPDPVGPENDVAIMTLARRAGMVICGWGNHGTHLGRAEAVVRMLLDAGIGLHYLKLSEKTGCPWHPLYIGYDVKPQVWNLAR